MIEEDLRLAVCAMGPLIQALVGWGINIEYLVEGSYQFNYFDHLWFASVFLSILPALLWPEEPRPARADRTGEELGYQVRYWLLLLVLVPLTSLAFLRAFDPKAAAVVSMAILGGVVFSWIASRVLLDRIRSSAELKTLSATAQFASQVAHDIRSPLAALEVVMRSAQSLPEDEKAMVRLAVDRVRGIADGMLKMNREALARTREHAPGLDEFVPSGEPMEKACLRRILPAMLAEKRREFGGLAGVRFQETLPPDGEPVFVQVQPRELERMLSNLINNAVESFASQAGTVEAVLSVQDGGAAVEIRDDGKGIAAERLRSLGERGATFGKTGGSGLGVFHAAQTMRFWGGRLDVESKVGAGTKVRLTFQRRA